MFDVTTVPRPTEVVLPTSPEADQRERRLIALVVSLAQSLREERDRLARRLREVEHELAVLAAKLEAGEHAADANVFSRRGTAPRGERPPIPSRTRR